MTIEGITLGQVAVIVAFVVALQKGLETVIGWFRKPADTVEKKLEKRLGKIEDDNKMMLKVLYSLLQHEVTGDHATDMSALYGELSDYLIGK